MPITKRLIQIFSGIHQLEMYLLSQICSEGRFLDQAGGGRRCSSPASAHAESKDRQPGVHVHLYSKRKSKDMLLLLWQVTQGK